jgi:HAE1 family hydrophobic/amphiphilic exporter-1
MFKVFIERPVLSTVISVLLVLLGLLGLSALPVSQYPDIAPPTVQVTGTYTGANSDVVQRSVVVPLEEEINGVEGMTYLTSTAGNDGTATITIYFKPGTDPDLAAVNVQNRVSKATPLLPAEVTQTGVSVTKRQSSMLLIFSLYSDNPSYDETFLQNYAKINIVPKIQRVEGVGQVFLFGTRDYSMRIWLKPDVMASYGLVPSDISALLAQQNVEAAPGKLGENGNQSFQYVLRYKGRKVQASEYGDLIVRTTPTGQVLRLKDIAKIELGALDYSSTTTVQGKPGVVMAVYQTAGSNAHSLVNAAKQVLADAAPFFPKGVHTAVLSDTNRLLDASIEKVIHTLLEAFVLVFVVVFVFLQDFRSTLIPAIAVPVAIVGTFFFLNVMGFTINLLTLFALVLAIGIVVDDAIVVVEAVHAKLDEGAPTAKEATLSAMSEITGAIISITLVMAAVFLPVSFITGAAGVFYKQFGLTLAIAILISAVNALTLSPALCALLLKPHPQGEHAKSGVLQRFYTSFNASFESVTGRYIRSVGFLSRHKWVALAGIALFAGSFWWLLRTTPSTFVPNEDQGTIFADISLPPASSLERTERVANQIDSIMRSMPGQEVSSRITGFSFLNGAGSSYGVVILSLKSWDKREQPIAETIEELYYRTAHIKGAQIVFFSPPTLDGFGTTDGFELQLQDRAGGDAEAMGQVSQQFLAALNQRPEIQFATSSFNPNFPQYLVDVNAERGKAAGLTPQDVLGTLQGYLGGTYASNFNQFGKQYRVMVQAEAAGRTNLESLNRIFVRSANGTMAPITEFVTLTRVFGPETLSRFNLYLSATITGSPNPGYSSGDAIRAVREVAAQTLPRTFGYEFSGLTREEIAAGSQALFAFLLCLVFAYFLLSAQYESYILPLAVLLSLPVGLAGAFIFATLFGITNSIYLQISLIMLIGLLAKNAILIVEFSLSRRRHGLPLLEAALEGAKARFRPILMTSFAFILGLVPLMMASGAGAVSNRSIGTVAVGGMLIGTVLGVFVIPVLFILFQALQEKISGPPAGIEPASKNQDALAEPASATPEVAALPAH